MLERFLYVVTRMDGFEELVEEFFEVTFVEGFYGCYILYVGLCLFHGAVDGLLVVEPLCEGYNFGAYEDVAAGDFAFQADTFQ